MSSDQSAGMRTLVIGIDGACRSVLDPLIDRGELPTVEGLLDSGASAPLESQIPPWTPSAWPSIYTGMNPGKHGVFDFITFDGYDWQVSNGTHVRERAIWELLSQQGLSSVVVNVPVTYPPVSFDGALVPGYMAPEHPTCHPAGILETIREEIGEYRVYPEHTNRSPLAHEEAVSEYRRLTSMRGRAFRHLADQFEPDFGFIQFQQTDTVFHERPGDQDAVSAVYAAVDHEIGETLEQCDPDTVFVVSDHGIGRYDGFEFRVNELLRREGFVETKRGGPGMPSWATVRDRQLIQGESTLEPQEGRLQRVMAMLARMGLTSQRISALVDRFGLEDIVLRLAPAGAAQAATEQVDFEESRAYMRSRIELGIRINLVGREPNGKVPPEEYETVRDELISLLQGIRTPTGKPVFDEVGRREAYYQGSATSEAVDIVTVPASFDQFLSTRLDSDLFDDPTEPWNHKLEGIVAVWGAGADSEAPLDHPHIFDVAPSVLASLDIPRDERMDGSVLPPVESAGQRRYPEYVRPDSVRTDDDDVERHLANLGYLDK